MQKLFWRRSVRERIQKQTQNDNFYDHISHGKPIHTDNKTENNCEYKFETAKIETNSEDSTSLKRQYESNGCDSNQIIDSARKKQRVALHNELVRYQIPRYLKFVLVKNNIEQSEAFRLMASQMKRVMEYYTFEDGESLSQVLALGLTDKSYLHSFSISGTKDKRGITAQFCCLELLPSWVNKAFQPLFVENSVISCLNSDVRLYIRILEAASRCLLDLNDISVGINIGNVAYGHSALALGQHCGNRFQVVYRHVPWLSQKNYLTAGKCVVCSMNDDILPSMDNEIGFPNFFGTQRFGMVDSCMENDISTKDITENQFELHDQDQSFNLLESAKNKFPLVEERNVLPIGARVGKHLIKSNYIAASHCLILGDRYCYDESSHSMTQLSGWVCEKCSSSSVSLNEEFVSRKSTAVKHAREMYANGAQPSKVLKQLPTYITKERWLLQGIIRYCGDRNLLEGASIMRCCDFCNFSLEAPIECKTSDSFDTTLIQLDYQRAFETIPYHSRTMWVHAYGSWIWNRVASYRLFSCSSSEKSLKHLLPGDLIRSDDISVANKDFTEDSGDDRVRAFRNGTKCTTIGVSQAVLPLIGSNVVFPGGATGRYNIGSMCYRDMELTSYYAQVLSGFIRKRRV